MGVGTAAGLGNRGFALIDIDFFALRRCHYHLHMTNQYGGRSNHIKCLLIYSILYAGF